MDTLLQVDQNGLEVHGRCCSKMSLIDWDDWATRLAWQFVVANAHVNHGLEMIGLELFLTLVPNVNLNMFLLTYIHVPRNRLLLDRFPNIGPLISRWELDKFKNCWYKSFRTSKILTLLYQQFSNVLISQRDMSGPRLGALSNNRWSGVLYYY